MAKHTELQQHIWRNASVKLIPSFALAVVGAIISESSGRLRTGDIGDKLLALIGVTLFLLFAIAFLQTLTHTLTQLLAAHPARRLNKGRAGALRFMMRVVGYVAIGLITLELIGIAVGNLLIGGAALGIVLGVAAQQALANFFAGIVLIITHPYAVGDKLTFNSGGLGGRYEGVIKDIGLTHTRLRLDEDDSLILFPNAALLSGATIIFAKPK